MFSVLPGFFLHSAADLFVQALAGVCAEVEGKAGSQWLDLQALQ